MATPEENLAIQELSNEFDILYNNIMSNQAPGLDEYEKSVFLTKAQNEIVKNYFNPKGNKYQEGFDGSQKRQIDFSNLMKTDVLDATKVLDEMPEGGTKEFLFNVPGAWKITGFPEDIFVVVNEAVEVQPTNDESVSYKRLQVIPIKYDEYTRICSKPYKQPLKNQAWRIISSSDEVNLIIGHNNTFIKYFIRYVKHPEPIILESLEATGVSIGGNQNAAPCRLDPEIIPEIIQRAVELAKAAYTGDLKSSIELGQRSE